MNQKLAWMPTGHLCNNVVYIIGMFEFLRYGLFLLIKFNFSNTVM